jgi:hypothetical protein
LTGFWVRAGVENCAFQENQLHRSTVDTSHGTIGSTSAHELCVDPLRLCQSLLQMSSVLIGEEDYGQARFSAVRFHVERDAVRAVWQADTQAFHTSFGNADLR